MTKNHSSVISGMVSGRDMNCFLRSDPKRWSPSGRMVIPRNRRPAPSKLRWVAENATGWLAPERRRLNSQSRTALTFSNHNQLLGSERRTILNRDKFHQKTKRPKSQKTRRSLVEGMANSTEERFAHRLSNLIRMGAVNFRDLSTRRLNGVLLYRKHCPNEVLHPQIECSSIEHT